MVVLGPLDWNPTRPRPSPVHDLFHGAKHARVQFKVPAEVYDGIASQEGIAADKVTSSQNLKIRYKCQVALLGAAKAAGRGKAGHGTETILFPGTT